MLRMTSKRVQEIVDKMRLPAVVRLSRSFWNDARNGTEKDKRQFVLRQLAAMTALCRITKLELRSSPHSCVFTCNYRTTRRVACRRSAGAVPSACAP
jgi:hypothetical protein